MLKRVPGFSICKNELHIELHPQSIQEPAQLSVIPLTDWLNYSSNLLRKVKPVAHQLFRHQRGRRKCEFYSIWGEFQCSTSLEKCWKSSRIRRSPWDFSTRSQADFLTTQRPMTGCRG